MKKMLAVLAAVLALSCAALAVEPLLLDTTRNGNRYYLTGYEQSEGRIKVVLRCVFSDEEWIKTVAQLAQQGVPAGDARKMVCNEYSLRYSADGTRYQRLYDRYLDAEGFTVRNLNQNPDAWYDTPAQPEQVPAKALLKARRLLGVSPSQTQPLTTAADDAKVAPPQPREKTAEPLLLDTSRSGNRFYLTEYEQVDGRITVVIRCLFSDSEWNENVTRLTRQGVPAADARKMACNDYCLRYSEDGSRYQRLYDRYLDSDGYTVRNLNQNPDAWYDTPSQPQQLPAKALLEAGRLLGVPVKLPQAAQGDNGDAASLQSRSAPRSMSVAVATASYRADKKLFAANYENAFMRLSGVRGPVTRERGQLALILQPQSGGQGVVCLFSEDVAAKLKRIAQGAQLTVEGVYRRGKTSKGAFVLETCEIVSK